MGSKMSEEKRNRKDLRHQIKAGQKSRYARLPLINENYSVLDSEASMRKPDGRYNAMKHGGFSKELFLSEEEVEEFNLQHQNLIAEYKPHGASEEEAVLTLAQCYAHKRQIDSWYWAEAHWLSRHPGFDAIDFLDWPLLLLGRAEHLLMAHEVIRHLPQPYLQRMLPELNTAKPSDEKQEIQRLKEILEHWIKFDAIPLEMQEDAAQFKAETGLLLRELTEKKIAVEERIDSRIDKTIKRLALLKTLKQVAEIPAAKAAIENHHSV
jgi:hypothetical protein